MDRSTCFNRVPTITKFYVDENITGRVTQYPHYRLTHFIEITRQI